MLIGAIEQDLSLRIEQSGWKAVGPALTTAWRSFNQGGGLS